jgi:low density lipoprotein receptor-related protein 5/6
MINYDGTDRREVITDNIVHVFGLSLLGDHLYWTDWQRRGIDSAHKITGADRKVLFFFYYYSSILLYFNDL